VRGDESARPRPRVGERRPAASVTLRTLGEARIPQPDGCRRRRRWARWRWPAPERRRPSGQRDWRSPMTLPRRAAETGAGQSDGNRRPRFKGEVGNDRQDPKRSTDQTRDHGLRIGRGDWCPRSVGGSHGGQHGRHSGRVDHNLSQRLFRQMRLREQPGTMPPALHPPPLPIAASLGPAEPAATLLHRVSVPLHSGPAAGPPSSC
jgi:hypothetical protein